MKTDKLAVAIAALLALGLGGCESYEQREALKQYRAFEDSPSGAVAKPADEKGLPKLTQASPLGDYLAYSSLNNPALEASFYRWKAALEAIPQARALPDPQFTFRYWAVQQAFRDGNMLTTYELSQTFPWLEKLQLRGDMSALEARAAYQRYEAQRLEVFAKVKESYYELAYIERAVVITQENLDRLKSIEEIARARYKTATGSQPDVIRLQVEVGKLDNELKSLRDLAAPVTAKLNAALNRPSDAPLPRIEMQDIPDLPVSDARLAAWMEESNPELKAIDQDIAREKASIELAKKDYLPDISLGVEIDQMIGAPGVSDRPGVPVAIGISVNIPIWWEKYAAGVRQAQARHMAAQKDKTDKSNNLQASVKAESFNFRNAGRKVTLYRDTLLPKATQAWQSTRSSYQTGTASFSDWIDTQRALLEFQLNYERALTDRQQALARLEALVGRSLTAPTSSPASQPATAPTDESGK